MNFLKKNKKLIIGILAGGIIFSGITGFAVNNYYASNIQYTNDKTVAQALNDLYDKLPKGTKTITEKGNQIDVSKFQFADTTGLYTAEEYNNYGISRYNEGLAVANPVKSGTFTSVENGDITLNIGFTPKKLVVSCDNNSLIYIYNSQSSTSQYIFMNSKGTLYGIANFNSQTAVYAINFGDGSRGDEYNLSTYLKSIGTSTVFHTYAAGRTWSWFATE